MTKLHLHQSKAYKDATRHQFILAGRRGGKTLLVRERLIDAVIKAPPKAEVFYIAPTLQDAYDIMWETMEDRLDEIGLKCKPLISKRRFEFSKRRKLYIIGAEKIRRIRGHAVYFVALDEVAFYGESLSTIWRAVRPALSDFGGRALVTTTPNGKGTDAYDFYLEALNKPEWSYHYWRTLDNPHIDQDEIEAAKRELDEKSFKQEYEATWESFEGLAYYNFEETTHLKPCKEINRALSIDIALDFNVNPTSLLVTQFEGNKLKTRREYSLRNSSTLKTIQSFCEDHQDYKNDCLIKIMGDAAGNSRHSSTGYADYHYVKEVLEQQGFRFQMCVQAKNPPIIDRVSYLNSWLKNYYGESRIEIDPSCKDLIRDLSSQELDGRHPSDKNNLGHKADALGYRVFWSQMTLSRKVQGTVQL